MSYSYNLATNVGKVRLLIHDTSEDSALFSDEEINSVLSLNDSDIYASASDLLYSVIANKALLAKSIRAGDYSEDTTGVVKALTDLAKLYKEKSDSMPAEAQAENIVNDFSWQDVFIRNTLRGQDE